MGLLECGEEDLYGERHLARVPAWWLGVEEHEADHEPAAFAPAREPAVTERSGRNSRHDPRIIGLDIRDAITTHRQTVVIRDHRVKRVGNRLRIWFRQRVGGDDLVAIRTVPLISRHAVDRLAGQHSHRVPAVGVVLSISTKRRPFALSKEDENGDHPGQEESRDDQRDDAEDRAHPPTLRRANRLANPPIRHYRRSMAREAIEKLLTRFIRVRPWVALVFFAKSKFTSRLLNILAFGYRIIVGNKLLRLKILFK